MIFQKTIRRAKRLYELSKKDPKVLEKLESFSEELVKAIPNEAPDVKAVFFGEGTDEEYKEQKDEDSGMKAWFDRLKL